MDSFFYSCTKWAHCVKMNCRVRMSSVIWHHGVSRHDIICYPLLLSTTFSPQEWLAAEQMHWHICFHVSAAHTHTHTRMCVHTHSKKKTENLEWRLIVHVIPGWWNSTAVGYMFFKTAFRDHKIERNNFTDSKSIDLCSILKTPEGYTDLKSHNPGVFWWITDRPASQVTNPNFLTVKSI